MKISESSITLRSSNFQFDTVGGRTDPAGNQPDPVAPQPPPNRNNAFAALLSGAMRDHAGGSTKQVSQSVSVTSKSVITAHTSPTRQINRPHFRQHVSIVEIQAQSQQWQQSSLFGVGKSKMFGASWTTHLFGSASTTFGIDFLLRICEGRQSYSNTFLAFLWYTGSALSPSYNLQPAAGGDTAPDAAVQTLLPRPQVDFEYQQMEFSSCGTVCTEDGRQIDFDFALNMTHSVLQQPSASLYAQWYNLYDPLILDLEGNGVGFSSEQFEFDLDADGTEESISCLDWGCGFLAYDQNQDGIVNNGLELFGTTSGNGFGDLAQYDLDGNNWIDENDAIFDELSIWRKDEAGADSLLSLAEAEVGAIYLDHVATAFGVHDDNDNFRGEITGSGIYLKETGEVQSVHQVDMVAEAGAAKAVADGEGETPVVDGSEETTPETADEESADALEGQTSLAADDSAEESAVDKAATSPLAA